MIYSLFFKKFKKYYGSEIIKNKCYNRVILGRFFGRIISALTRGIVGAICDRPIAEGAKRYRAADCRPYGVMGGYGRMISALTRVL